MQVGKNIKREGLRQALRVHIPRHATYVYENKGV